MNLLYDYQKKILEYLEYLKKEKIIIFPDQLKNIAVEFSPKEFKTDISCNAAMILSKFNEKTPLEIANVIKKDILENFDEFEKIEIAKPGFININFKTGFWAKYIHEIVKANTMYGSNRDSKLKYNIEFVSANPTGPLHVGHCRGAILGDVLCNLLKFNGHSVTKEYYVNDYGEQIKDFVLSVYYRILEIIDGKKFPSDDNLYPGDYIVSIAKKIVDSRVIKDFTNFDKIYKKLCSESLNLSLELIKNNLDILGIKHDHFVYESELISKNLVSKVVKELQKDNYVYSGKLNAPKVELEKNWESRDQLLFNSTKFGDDSDRALQKTDKSWTYFASDIAYHANKINRNFDVLINVLGADHAGYIKRIVAAVKAISKDKTKFICKVSQLVKLFKNGKPFKMSKRKGDYVTVDDLIKEVGKDSVRFMMLNRSNDVELDFDFTKVTEKSKDNPVFYVQYAYARINSIFRVLQLDINDTLKYSTKDFDFDRYEIEIIKKISGWPKCVELSSIKLEPHRIPFYLYDLSTLFHSYWNLGNEKKEFRFILNDKPAKISRLLILQALALVIQNGMYILGVSTPKSM